MLHILKLRKYKNDKAIIIHVLCLPPHEHATPTFIPVGVKTHSLYPLDMHSLLMLTWHMYLFKNCMHKMCVRSITNKNL